MSFFRAAMVTVHVALVALAGSADAHTAGLETDAIAEAGRRFSAAYMRGDTDAIMALYTRDAVIFPERSNAISGQDAIRRYWGRGQGSSVTRHQLTPASVVVDGKHAYDHGTFEIAGVRDGKSWGPFHGKYLVVWRKEPDGWKMALDMWNSGPEPGS